MTKEKERFLRVTDSSCTEEHSMRTHSIKVRGEIIDVTFIYGEPKIPPFEQGIKFMLDGFKVEEVGGGELILPAITKEGVKASIKSDEAVANLSELTLSSLILRASQKPGGEIYLDAGEASRDDIIAFIKGEPPVAGPDEAVADVAGDDDESLIDEGDSEDTLSLGAAEAAEPETETESAATEPTEAAE